MKMRSYRSLPHLSLNNIMVIQMGKRKQHVDAINWSKEVDELVAF